MARTSVPTVIIIGAGIGGLSSAVDLCRRGIVNVTVLEKSSVAGGKVHQTHIDGFSIDSGPTVLTLRAVFDQLFSRAGERFDERVGLIPLEKLARHYWHDGSVLDLYSDIDRTCDEIAAFSSMKEADSYRRFAKNSEALFNALDDSFMRRPQPGLMQLGLHAGPSHLWQILRSSPFVSLWRSLQKTFTDTRLQQLFARYSTYCGSSPFAAPATLMLIAHAECKGVWTLQGGMQSLASALSDVAIDNGCDLRLDCGVRRICATHGVANGVELDDGSIMKADAIIHNGDVNMLSDGSLGSDVVNAVASPKARALSAITLSCVSTVKNLDLSFHNVFFGEDYRSEFEHIFKRKTICADPTIYVCAQDRLPEHHLQDHRLPDQLSEDSQVQRLFCLMNAPAVSINDEQLQADQQKLLDTLGNHGLALSPGQDQAVFASPNTFATRFPSSDGSLYGAPTHGWSGSFSRSGVRSRIRGLYLAGGGVHPGAGVPMVSLSGQMAAQCVIDDL